jgi:hypothetical protein
MIECIVVSFRKKMAAANHPERFPADPDMSGRNDRVAALIQKYKTQVRHFLNAIDLLSSLREPIGWSL